MVFPSKIYTIFCVPLVTPIVLYLQYHRAASDGRKSDSLCNEFSEVYRLIPLPFVGNCTSDLSCRCNVSLRQHPSLNNLASHTVFQLTFNLSQFTLSCRTFCHKYLCAGESNIVSEEEVVPIMFLTLKYTFVRDKRCAICKRFHHDCVIPSEGYCPATYTMFCMSPEEDIVTKMIIGGVISVLAIF